MSPPSPRGRAWPVPLLWVGSVALALGLGFVFARWTFGPPPVDEAVSTPPTVAVSTMTVGRSIPVAVAASWTARPFGVGAAQGVLTSLNVADGAVVSAGDVLFTVDLRPVIAATGAVPAFRDLEQGAKGSDVAQLQQLLGGLGLFAGDPDGAFNAATTTAVKAWQRSLGVEVDGVVRASDIVYAADLPARVRVADGFTVGTRLSAGDVVLSALEAEPEFTATVLAGSPVSAASPIEVVFNGATVEAVVSATRDDQAGNSLWTLTTPDGGAICGEGCGEVSLEPALAVYPASQIVTPSATGPGVPAAAVWFTAAGDAYLVRPDGVQLPVTIVSEGQGNVVVSGVEVGTVVVLADGVSLEPTQPVAAPQPTESPS